MTLLTSNNTPALHHTYDQVGARPMHNRLILAGLAATGGLLTTAFLQVAVAAADTGAVAAAGADAFTIGGYTFDPQLAAGGEGFDPVVPARPPRPRCSSSAAEQRSACRSPLRISMSTTPTSGTELGSIQGNETILSLFGLTNAEFTVASGILPPAARTRCAAKRSARSTTCSTWATGTRTSTSPPRTSPSTALRRPAPSPTRS